MEDNILTERKGNVFIIKLNRPKRMNALDRETIKTGAKLIRELHYDKETRDLFPDGPRRIAFYLKEMIKAFDLKKVSKADLDRTPKSECLTSTIKKSSVETILI